MNIIVNYPPQEDVVINMSRSDATRVYRLLNDDPMDPDPLFVALNEALFPRLGLDQ